MQQHLFTSRGWLLPSLFVIAACGAEDPNGGDMQLGAEQTPPGATVQLPAANPPPTGTLSPVGTATTGSMDSVAMEGAAPSAPPGAEMGQVPETPVSPGSEQPGSEVPGPGNVMPDPDQVDPAPTDGAPDPMDPNVVMPEPTEPGSTPVDPEDTTPVPMDPVADAGSQCADGQLASGFYVEDGRIYDNHCAEFVMRGVNYPYVWFKDSQSTEQMFRDIAATGANTVRVVLATGDQWPRISGDEITSIIGWAKANKLVAMLEVHDATGYGDKAEATDPQNAVNYWLSDDIKSAINGEEAYVMVNIANEPFGNDATDQWEPFHSGAVAALRAGGLKHLLIVDAPNWGQDWSNTMRDGMGANNIFAADPDANTAFSVHMYDVYGTSELVWSYFENFLGSGMALLVGEFAADHGPGKDVDEDTILAGSREHRLGYLGWSWSGNSSDLSSLDLVQDFNASAYSSWGQRLIDGQDGIRETSQLCRCFE